MSCGQHLFRRKGPHTDLVVRLTVRRAGREWHYRSSWHTRWQKFVHSDTGSRLDAELEAGKLKPIKRLPKAWATAARQEDQHASL